MWNFSMKIAFSSARRTQRALASEKLMNEADANGVERKGSLEKL